jgi:uncharacterized phage protein (TIGR01671 family)|nr:MAG TPA: YopX protein [Caudoviricetes sp.]
MREYLFRGKRLDNGEWVEGSLLTCTRINKGKVYICPETNVCEVNMEDEGKIIDVGLNFGCWYEVDPETVGQFTGLTDKNGRKIFEGDVLSWVDWKGIKRSSCVQYDAEWNRFCVRLSGAESIGVNRHLSSDIEVIGNRWDNPELLEGV